jgi:hypothetical protein
MLTDSAAAETILPANGRLVMLGSMEQRQEFIDVFGRPRADSSCSNPTPADRD